MDRSISEMPIETYVYLNYDDPTRSFGRTIHASQ